MSHCGARALVALLTLFVLSLGIGLYTGVLLPRPRVAAPLLSSKQKVTTSLQESLQDSIRTLVGSAESTVPSLQDSLRVLLGIDDAEKARRLAAIERTLHKTFPALPKNADDRIGPRSVRYLVHRHFAEEDGWRIKGLEPASEGVRIRTMGQPGGMRLGHVVTSDNEVQSLSFLQKKAPQLVKAMEQIQETGYGFSLGDAAAVIMVFENLIFADSLELLNASYKVNKALPSEPLSSGKAYEVALSYFTLFDSGSNPSDDIASEIFAALKALHGQEFQGVWARITKFAQDNILSYQTEHNAGRSGGREVSFSYKNMSHIAEHMIHAYGKWQDEECKNMKQDLMLISNSGTGRVPVDRFYAQPKKSTYTFAESLDELRKMGALDESLGGPSPMVVLANYVLAPSNCLATTSYYSVCCLNECEGLMAEVEGRVLMPSVDPDKLLAVVANISSASVGAPRTLSESLVAKLASIAAQHGGEVPLHSRLFSQWMHFAFPNECPYPQVFKASNPAAPLNPEDFVWRGPEQLEADKAEFLAKAHKASRKSTSRASQQQGFSQWTDDEVMLLQEPHAHGELGSIICLLMQVLSLVVVLNMAMAIWQSARSSHRKGAFAAAVDMAPDRRAGVQAGCLLA